MSTPISRRRLRRWLGAAVGVLSCLLLLWFAGVTVLLLQQSQSNGRAADRIEDCTSPEGQCYKDAQARTAEAVLGIKRDTLDVVVAALSCQEDGVKEQKALARCTISRLEKRKP